MTTSTPLCKGHFNQHPHPHQRQRQQQCRLSPPTRLISKKAHNMRRAHRRDARTAVDGTTSTTTCAGDTGLITFQQRAQPLGIRAQPLGKRCDGAPKRRPALRARDEACRRVRASRRQCERMRFPYADEPWV
eukprot:COSAG01_NODE_669_length_14379_cov_292.353011_6_plen_132_part_00